MTIVVNANYQQFESQLASIYQIFDDADVTLQAGRNHIKSAHIGDEKSLSNRSRDWGRCAVLSTGFCERVKRDGTLLIEACLPYEECL